MSKKMNLNAKKVATQTRLIAIVIALLFLLSGCSTQNPASNAEQTSKMEQSSKTVENSRIEESKAESEKGNDESSADKSTDIDINTERLDTLREAAAKDTEDAFAKLTDEYEKLLAETDTYEKYLSNADKVEAFYSMVVDDTEQLCIRLREYSVEYAKIIVSSDESYRDKYDELEAIYDDLYDDIGEDIYDGILDDIYDELYDGVLDDGYDNASYSEWAEVRSDEYDWWSDARSDVYRKWSDFRSEVYRFWSDIRSEVYKDRKEKVQSTIDDFVEDIEKMK